MRQRRRLVEEWSDGRLGYLHIQGMSAPSFEVFERDLFAAADGKEGLIIDVRSNGGGWTTDYLMAVLTVQRHAYTLPRDGDPSVKSYPTAERLPVAAFTRPAAALCNEDSYSNAEIFSWAFQTLERGPLVGSPTFGAVISTGGMQLINGGLVRLPGPRLVCRRYRASTWSETAPNPMSSSGSRPPRMLRRPSTPNSSPRSGCGSTASRRIRGTEPGNSQF